MLKNALTYEIMTPASVGVACTAIVLGKHSGRHALAKRFEDLGYKLSRPELDRAYEVFCRLADRKKRIYDEDLLDIASRGLEGLPQAFNLRKLSAHHSHEGPSAATVEVERDGEHLKASANAEAVEDAVFRALDLATGISTR